MTRATTGWFTAAAVLTFASLVMGAVVCATQSGAACPNWPGCYGDQFLPTPGTELATNPLIEFTHRVIAGATGPAVLVAAVLGRRLADARPRRLAWIGLAGTLSAGVFGMLIVKVGIPWWLGVLDLASALLATVSMLLARLLLSLPEWRPDRTARVAWAGVGALALLHLLALAVAGTDSFTRCLGWPLGVLAADRWPALQVARVVLAAAAAVLIVLAVAGLARRPGLRLYAWLAAGLLIAELALAASLLAGAGSVGLRTVYAVVAAALFGAAALLAARSGVSSGDARGQDRVRSAGAGLR
jgi:cytochrome c oxidase assembly protein subunit 15